MWFYKRKKKITWKQSVSKNDNIMSKYEWKIKNKEVILLYIRLLKTCFQMGFVF